MDIQKLMDALSEASRNTRSDYHVTLGQLIELVKGTTGLVRFADGGGPGEEMSYRGYYSDLSFGEGPPAQAAAFLEQLQKALGATYEGYKGGEDVLGPDWSISASGLSYKPWSNYLTLEGYPTGTTCWYVRIDAGWREMVCGETPELALVRGLIVFATAQKQRPTAPRKRRELHEELASPVAPPPP